MKNGTSEEQDTSMHSIQSGQENGGEALEKIKNKSPQEQSKMIHIETQNELGNKNDPHDEVSKITMTFEGLKAEAKGKNNISSVLASYTGL